MRIIKLVGSTQLDFVATRPYTNRMLQKDVFEAYVFLLSSHYTKRVSREIVILSIEKQPITRD